MARYLKNTLGLNKIALYYANAANGISYADAFRKEFLALGGNLVFDEKYIEKSTDFRSDLLKMKTSAFDGVYIAGVATEMAQILVQAKDAGINTKWFASSGAENPKLIEIAKGNAEGLIFTTPAFNPEQKGGSVEKFTEAYEQKYGELPNFAAANGYDGVMLVYQVMNKYGYDAESIKKGLYATKDFPGVGGMFSFDEFGEVEKEIMFKVVKDGQFVKLGE
jgi:branched-chain amino acid transport system substrate-binding protein